MTETSHCELSLQAGFWSGSGGFLRPSVGVRSGNFSWTIRHSIWELEIPHKFVSTNPAFRDFLERRISIAEVQTKNRQVSALLSIFAGQGCLTYDGTRETYSLDELNYIVNALVYQWYGIYYGHEFWKSLGECRLSIPQLFAWVLRTYHLSRSAGITAARGANSSPTSIARRVFLKSTMEEYPHFECYYFPRHRLFGLEDRWIRELMPLASSTAFDHQMAHIAEHDWLAHTIVAYFQEYSVAFRENAFALYDRIEAAYGLDHFFDGWKQHVGYDLSQTHADDFAELLQGSADVPRTCVLKSLKEAAMTIEYLLGALDELAQVERDTTLNEFRVSPALVSCGANKSSILGGIDGLDRLLERSKALQLCRALVAIVISKSHTKAMRMARLLRVVLSSAVVTDLLLRALGRWSDHATIIALGRLLEQIAGDSRPTSIYAQHAQIAERPIVNALRELTIAPTDFICVFWIACELALVGETEAAGAELKDLREVLQDHLAHVVLDRDNRTRIAYVGFQFAEICEIATRLWRHIPEQDVLSMHSRDSA